MLLPVAACNRLYTAAGVRELDRREIEDHGIDGYALMRTAGTAAFRLLRLRWPGARKLAVFCGGGNNGGDGLVIARLAQEAGLQAAVGLATPAERLSGSAARALADYRDAGGGLLAPDEVDGAAADVIVDALLGTGLASAVREPYAGLIERINAAGRPVLAVDIPSGLSADTGAVLGTAVRASATMTFIGRKRGLYTGAAPACTGPVFADDLQTPPQIHQDMEAVSESLDAAAVCALLPRRAPTVHKGAAGHLVVVAGNTGMAGAARLAGEAALRTGAGLVTVATRSGHAAALAGGRPELMARGVDDPEAELAPLLAAADAFVVGPGLGRDEWARMALEQVLAKGPSAGVLDADALNTIAADGGAALGPGCVVTPHPGEAGRMLGTSAAAVEADRFDAVWRLAERYGATVVLKGAGTLIGEAQRAPALIDEANAAMATGGTGDVLAGTIGALLAQGMAPSAAARAGAWLHARAGRLAVAEGGGLIASDLMGPLGRLRWDVHVGHA